MSYPVKSIKSTGTLMQVSAFMNILKIRQIPVVDKDKLIGIITEENLIRNMNQTIGFDVNSKRSHIK